MYTNMGKADRIIRLILGVALIALGILYSGWLIAVGVILLLTALLSYCPLYSIFRLSSKKKKSA